MISVFFIGVSHLSKMLLGFFLLKIIAYYLGAEGLGKLGNFMTLLTIITLLSGGGILNAIIKYSSEYKRTPRKLIKIISASCSYSLFFSIVLFVFFVFFAKEISYIVFSTDEYSNFIVIFALAQSCIALVNIVVGVSNGLGLSIVYSKIQTIGVLIALPISWALISNFGFKGAILSLLVSVTSTVLPGLFFIFKSKLTKFIKIRLLSLGEFKRLVSFSIMLLFSSLTFPVVEYLIRNHLIETSGYTEAGLWQGAIKLSSAYTSIFAVFLAYWFMPKISSESDWINIKTLTIKTMIAVMSVFSFGAIVFYFWSEFFISILLSSDFITLSKDIFFQLIGDFFKIGAYVIGFIGVAKAATKLYILAEFLQSLLFISFSFYMSMFFSGAKGVMIAYAQAYLCYYLFVAVLAALLYRKTLKK